MKLLLENWRQYLDEDNECRVVIAYHGSPLEFDKFSMERAEGPRALYFTTDRDQVLKFKPVTYIYEVELTLCGEGVRYPQEPSEDDKYVWDYGTPIRYEDEKPMVYKMFDDKDIKILNIEEETEFFGAHWIKNETPT